MNQERRGSWYLLTGVVLGVAMGLIYSWVISPVTYVDAPPYALRTDYKDQYRALVAAAYLYSHDLRRAQDRLAQLKDDNPAQSVAMQAQRALAEGHPEEEVRALSALATALGQGVMPGASSLPPTPVVTSIPETSGFTPTPLLIEPSTSPSTTLETTVMPLSMIRTQAPLSIVGPNQTVTPTPTLGAPFALLETRLVCNRDQPEPLIQVEIKDAAGQPVPSIELVVTWDGGEDHFFTGLQPELDLGYADFVMTPEVVYSIHLVQGGQAIDALKAAECVSEDESRYWGSWFLTFKQP
jgi:hypothetical protein